jgi:hypothetical protein
MSGLWRTLKPGDVVRMADMPPEYDRPESLHDDTRSIYQYLIDSRMLLVVAYMDELNYPWVRFEYVADDGQLEYHSLMLNHGGLELVSRRT